MYLTNLTESIVIPFTGKVETRPCYDEKVEIRHGDIELVYGEASDIIETMHRFVKACEKGENVFNFGRAYAQVLVEREGRK